MAADDAAVSAGALAAFRRCGVLRRHVCDLSMHIACRVHLLDWRVDRQLTAGLDAVTRGCHRRGKLTYGTFGSTLQTTTTRTTSFDDELLEPSAKAT